MGKALFIIGPTASGKTELAVKKAIELDGEIISADSRQVYRRMDIGTGKDLAEYTVDGKTIPHHLIDICEPDERYNINRFYEDATEIIRDIWSREKLPIVCGGSGLYLQTLLEGNPLSAIPIDFDWREEAKQLTDNELEERFNSLPVLLQKKLDKSTRKRQIRALEIGQFVAKNGIPEERKLKLNAEIIGLNPSREIRRERISKRLAHRLENGMIEEVQSLLDEGISMDQLRYFGLEYKWIADFIAGKMDRERLQTGLESAIHQFAKRQMTWFRKMEREGYAIEWI